MATDSFFKFFRLEKNRGRCGSYCFAVTYFSKTIKIYQSMRNSLLLFGLLLSTSLVAQETTISNFGPEFVKGHQENDLYEIEIIRASKQGYAVQIASLSNYPSVVRLVTELQGKWFDNVLLKLDQTAQKQTVYKILMGPFTSKKEATEYQKSLALEGYKGFVTFLAASKVIVTEEVTQVPVTPAPTPTPKPTSPTPPSNPPTTTTYVPTGEASYYSDKFHGLTTAHGEQYNMHDYTAAHWTLPHNTKLKVCRIDNGKCVQVRVNDRGPNPAKAIARDGTPRIIDLSLAAAKVIGLEQAGITQVRIEIVAHNVVVGPTESAPIPTPSDELVSRGAKPNNTGTSSPVTTVYQSGEASYYAAKFHGRTTASGELFDMHAMTAAHWTLPFQTKIEVCNLSNGKCVQVRVNDRGPNPKKAIGKDGKPRVVDLSLAAAEQIGLVQAGITQVSIKLIE